MDKDGVYRVLVMISDLNNACEWMKVVSNLDAEDIEITLHGVTTVPLGISLTEAAKNTQGWRNLLSEFAKPMYFFNNNVRVLVDYEPYNRIVEEAVTLKPNLLIVQGAFNNQSRKLKDWMLHSVDCEVVLLDGQEAVKEEYPLLIRVLDEAIYVPQP